jgi:WD40 repeat protein
LDCDTRKLTRTIKVDDYVCAVALSKDHIATGVGSYVCLFDVETGDRKASMKGHSRNILTIAFLSDGSLIASGNEDGGVTDELPVSALANKSATQNASIEDGLTYADVAFIDRLEIK